MSAPADVIMSGLTGGIREVPDLSEDCHVHSTFSDGQDSLEANVAWAQAIGVTRLVAVEHVRRDSTYLPELAEAARRIRLGSRLPVLEVGAEAKLLNRFGELDMPKIPPGIDAVYIADHQFPSDDGPRSPASVRRDIESGEMTADDAIRTILGATRQAMIRHAGRHSMVLAHLFSILPKLGLCESMVSEYDIRRLAWVAARTHTTVEVSERWRCPSERVVRAMVSRGVRVIASTDAHSAGAIARYRYVERITCALTYGYWYGARVR